LREQIEKALQHLVGMPMWRAGRAADMQCFGLGARHPIINDRGELTEVGDYALHISCGWRIVGPAGIVVGRRDLFYPAGDDPYQGLDDFDYEGPTPNRRDVRVAALLQERASSPLVVESCSADDVGGFRLNLTGGFTLEAWPDDSLEGDYWRLFASSDDAPYFVVTGCGIDPD
jgi:hypothetical protein